MTPPRSRRPARLAAAGALAAALLLPAAGQERFRRLPPPPNPLQPVRLPAIESDRHPNGLTVRVVRAAGTPLACVHVVIHAGEADASDARPGLAEFTARMVARGTLQMSAGDVERRLEALGAAFSVSVSLDYTVFSMELLAENLGPALDVLGALIRRPAFDEKDAEAVRRTMHYALVGRENDPEASARNLLLRELFAGHAYRKGFYGDDVTRGLAARDAADFHRRFYRPNNSILTVVADVPLAAISGRLARMFATWPAVGIPRVPRPPVAANDRERVCFVEVPRARDAVVAAGNVAPAAGAPDAFAFQVLNQILGGTATSRLLLKLREERQYAYYAYSEADRFRAAGVYRAVARVTPSVLAPAVQEILRQIHELSTTRPDPLEVEQAKSLLIGAYPLTLEPLSRLSERAALLPVLGLGEAHWNGVTESIMTVHPDQVLEAARSWFRPRPIVVVAGDPARLSESLRDLDRVEVYDSRGAFRHVLQKGAPR